MHDDVSRSMMFLFTSAVGGYLLRTGCRTDFSGLSSSGFLGFLFLPLFIASVSTLLPLLCFDGDDLFI